MGRWEASFLRTQTGLSARHTFPFLMRISVGWEELLDINDLGVDDCAVSQRSIGLDLRFDGGGNRTRLYGKLVLDRGMISHAANRSNNPYFGR